MINEGTIACPFVYADGRKCCGHVAGWRVYGRRDGDPLHFAKKVRLWCSDKDDHAGADRSFAGKERMEFYPDKLPAGLYAKIEARTIRTASNLTQEMK